MIKKINISEVTKKLSAISFIMNFSSSMIISSALAMCKKDIMSAENYILIRMLAEGIGYISKVLVGTLSDFFKNRKNFLLMGYGLVFFLKILFFLSTFSYFSKETRVLFFSIANAGDRILNSARDIPRDALIVDYSQNNLKENFIFRRRFSYIGTLLGGISTTIFLKFSKNCKLLYFIAMILSIIPTFIILFMIEDNKQWQEQSIQKDKEKLEKSDLNIWILILLSTLFVFAGKISEVSIWNASLLKDEWIYSFFYTVFYLVCSISTCLVNYFKSINGLIVAYIFFIISNFIFSINHSFVVLLLSTILTAIATGMNDSLFVTTIVKTIKTNRWRATAIGLSNVVIGLSVTVNAFLFKFLMGKKISIFTLSFWSILPISFGIILLLFAKIIKSKNSIKNEVGKD